MSKLRELREEAGLTREQLARESGVSYNGLMGLEQGRWGMRLGTAHKLATALEKHLPYTLSRLLEEIAQADQEESHPATVA